MLVKQSREEIELETPSRGESPMARIKNEEETEQDEPIHVATQEPRLCRKWLCLKFHKT